METETWQKREARIGTVFHEIYFFCFNFLKTGAYFEQYKKLRRHEVL